MKRLLVLFLLFALPIQAGPKHWIQHHKRFLLAASAITVGSVIQYKGTSYCQHGDVERCVEGYGSRRAFNYFSMGIGAAMLGTSEACWKQDGPKPTCYGLAYWVPATQVSFGIHDFLNYHPETEGGTLIGPVRRF